MGYVVTVSNYSGVARNLVWRKARGRIGRLACWVSGVGIHWMIWKLFKNWKFRLEKPTNLQNLDKIHIMEVGVKQNFSKTTWKIKKISGQIKNPLKNGLEFLIQCKNYFRRARLILFPFSFLFLFNLLQFLGDSHCLLPTPME